MTKTFHRGMHDYNDEGRAPHIEAYIDELVSWVRPRSGFCNGTFVDVGCDYGYAMSQMLPYFKRVVGIEPNMNPYRLQGVSQYIIEGSLTADLLKGIHAQGSTMFWLNHVLEHFEDPIGALRLLNQQPNADVIMIATPDALLGGDDFVFRKSHVSVYTEGWYRHIAPNLLSNFELADLKSVTLRGDCYELWGLYRRKRYEA